MAEIDVIIAIILGIFQGVVEWLPISSTGQTILAMVDILDLDPDSAFSLAFFLHFGTLLAVLLKMRGDVKYILSRLPRYKEDDLVRFMLISTMASAIVGIPVYLLLVQFIKLGGGDMITTLVGVFLILTGFIIYFSKRKMGTRVVSGSDRKDSILAGIAQGFAVIPGISRSGVTVAAMVGRSFEHREALRLSLLMSIPAISGIIILETIRGGIQDLGVFPILAGVFTAFIVGYLMIDVLLRFTQKVKFDVFCIVFGAIATAVGLILLVRI
ncbi:MAG: undecaprenyl-diphosphate phosphatase [Thermoplasmata archaeon]|nr:MAG: undecaprenyl-diphosphate phosphatase [Thermoplasmata archaeon]